MARTGWTLRETLRTALVLAALLPGCSGGAGAGSAFEGCELVRVIDGDTLVAACGGHDYRVRLLRIDTPERGEPGFDEAGEALRRMVEGRELDLVFEVPGEPATDRYGRLLAYVLADGVDVNVEMVREGWSEFWTKYGRGRLADDFERAEREAEQRARRHR